MSCILRAGHTASQAHVICLRKVMCRLAAAHDAEQKRKQDERSKVGPQFVKGPSEQMKLLPYAKSTSGEGFVREHSIHRCSRLNGFCWWRLQISYSQQHNWPGACATLKRLPSYTGATSAAQIAAQAKAQALVANANKKGKWDSK